jgi:hypothetical protein
MSDSDPNNERRKREERRSANGKPPAGMAERRINIERRLFNLGVDCGKAWLDKAPHIGVRRATPFPDLNASFDLTAG